MDIKAVIHGLDELFAHEKMKEAGEYLRLWRQRAVEEKDLAAELSVVDEMMGYYRRAGEEERGLEAVDRGLFLLEKLGLTDTVDGGTVYLNAATNVRSFGQLDRGLDLYTKALHCYCTLPDVHPLRAGLYNNMASAYGDKGDYETASDYLLKSLFVLRELGGSIDEAVIFVNLAQNAYAKDPLDEKIYTYLDEALAVFDRPQTRTPYYAETARKCASAFGFFGYFVAEKDLNERADSIYEGN